MFAPPSAGLRIHRFMTASTGRANHGAPDQILVATEPGCSALTVTPVPASSAARLRACSTLASLDRL